MEVWRSIPSCPNYEASNLGRIRRAVPGKRTYVGLVLRQRLNGRGYWAVVVTHDGIQTTKIVHRLVCEAFNGPQPTGMIAAHNDGDLNNNTAQNVRWATPIENAQDCFRHGTAIIGERAPAAKLTASKVIAIRAAFAAGKTRKQLAEEFGVHHSNIWVIVTRKSWKHI